MLPLTVGELVAGRCQEIIYSFTYIGTKMFGVTDNFILDGIVVRNWHVDYTFM